MRKLFWIKIALSAALITALVLYIDVDRLIGAVFKADFKIIIISFFLIIPNLLLQWLKWRLLVRLVHKDVEPKHTFLSLIKGISLGLVTPGKFGEYGRALFLPYSSKAPLVGLTVIDKFYTQLAIQFFGLFSLIFLFGGEIFNQKLIVAAIWIIYSALSVLVFYYIMNPGIISRRIVSIKWKIMQREVAKRFISGLTVFNRRSSIKLLAFSITHVLVCILQFYIILYGFFEIEFWNGFLTLSVVLLLNSMLPLFPGNLGIREFSAVFLLHYIGVPGEAAFDSSILLFFINIFLPGITGYILILLQKSGKSETECQI